MVLSPNSEFFETRLKSYFTNDVTKKVLQIISIYFISYKVLICGSVKSPAQRFYKFLKYVFYKLFQTRSIFSSAFLSIRFSIRFRSPPF